MTLTRSYSGVLRQCANTSAGGSASAGQAQSCITQENDAIWNPSGVQADHAQ